MLYQPWLSLIFIQKETGKNLIDYVNERRIHTAANLLTYDSRPISQIAAQVGIIDSNYFTRLFKKIMEITPVEYREKGRQTFLLIRQQ